MFFNSGMMKSLEDSASHTWLAQQVHLQNMANISTPGYKAKQISFEQVLDEQDNVRKTPKITERTDTAIRPDGNNVDTDIESMELYKSYVQYSMILDKMRGEFSKFETVLNSNLK